MEERGKRALQDLKDVEAIETQIKWEIAVLIN